MSVGDEMDLRLREITWVRLVSLLLWTLLMMLTRAITQLTKFVKNRAFEVSPQTVSEEGQEVLKQETTLLPPLSDEFVLSQIWPLLHRRVNISLLWRLRRVNKAWRGKVGTSIEWAALEMVRVDAPGLVRYLGRKGERCPGLRERVESEMNSFAILLGERLLEFTPSLVSASLDEGGPVEVVVGESMNRVLEKKMTDIPSECVTCPCRWIDYGGFEEFQSRNRREYDWSEEEEIEAYASSSEGSFRAYYPRHFVGA